MKIKKNDEVLVIKGRERGKKGKVRSVIISDKRVVVEGINMIKRHIKAGGGARQAGIVTREAAIPVYNVMLICPKCHKPTRVGFQLPKEAKDKTKARVCRKCQEVIK